MSNALESTTLQHIFAKGDYTKRDVILCYFKLLSLSYMARLGQRLQMTIARHVLCVRSPALRRSYSLDFKKEVCNEPRDGVGVPSPAGGGLGASNKLFWG